MEDGIMTMKFHNVHDVNYMILASEGVDKGQLDKALSSVKPVMRKFRP